MYKKRDGVLKKSPEFCEALKFVIKFQITSLLQQLADSGEESVVITANVSDGTADHLGSNRGTGFLDQRDELQKQFLNYCAGSSLVGKLTSPCDSVDTLSPHLLTHTSSIPMVSPNVYHKDASPRIGYERENSTSDSVFSPNRRKSSASSRSVDEDIALYNAQEYADAAKSSRENAADWTDTSSFVSGDISEKVAAKYLSEQSPGFDDDCVKDASLSSPTYFQYPKVCQSFSRVAAISSTNSITYKSNQQTTPVTLLNPLTMYKLQMPTYSDSLSIKTSTVLESDDKPVYKSPYESTSVSTSHGQMTEPYTGVKASTIVSDYESLYKIQRKADTKIYHRQGSGSRKQSKSCIERRGSDSVSNFGYKTTSSAGQYVERKLSDSVLSPGYTTKTLTFAPQFTESNEKFAGVDAENESQVIDDSRLGQSDGVPMKSLDLSGEATLQTQQTVQTSQQSIHQNLFSTSLGLLSPVSRNLLSAGRTNMNRERSQSCSEVASISQEVHEAQIQARARFPSSSFVENLDTPLIIDDNIKQELESEEGLDLSQKRRKLSADNFTGLKEERTDAAADEQSIKEMYDRMTSLQNVSAAGTSSSDQSVKKYGKGNFIKVATGYQCRICCRVIRHMNNTTAHMRIHANIRPYKCQLCNQQFKYEVDRRYHFSKNHVDLFSKMYFPDGQKKPE